jgi:hypothetical protein
LGWSLLRGLKVPRDPIFWGYFSPDFAELFINGEFEVLKISGHLEHVSLNTLLQSGFQGQRELWPRSRVLWGFQGGGDLGIRMPLID